MCTMAGMGLTHGDLSAFNILATEERLVIIDVPQAVNIVGNPQGPEFLARDCRNVATWFTARGLGGGRRDAVRRGDRVRLVRRLERTAW